MACPALGRDTGRTLGQPLGERLPREPLHSIAVRPVSTVQRLCEPVGKTLQAENHCLSKFRQTDTFVHGAN